MAHRGEKHYPFQNINIIKSCPKVPESARGAGIGGQLAKAALDWAAARKIPKDQIANQTEDKSDQKEEEKDQPFVVLSCSFLKRWHHLNPMPEHANIVVEEDS